MSIISERLKYVRELRNITQMQVYNDTGIHHKTLSGYERNVSEPDIETLKKLAEYYNVDINYLLGTTNDINFQIKRFENLIKLSDFIDINLLRGPNTKKHSSKPNEFINMLKEFFLDESSGIPPKPKRTDRLFAPSKEFELYYEIRNLSPENQKEVEKYVKYLKYTEEQNNTKSPGD